MGREVRRVPANWQHPKDARGEYIPLYGGSYSQRLAEWEEGARMWLAGLRDDWNGGWKPIEDEYKEIPYGEWEGRRPVKEDYMPDWSPEQRTHYQMYETCTEGTPISPVMASPEELARWLTDTGASAFADMTSSYDAWLRVCEGGFAPSAVMNGSKLESGVEGLTEPADRNRDYWPDEL